VAEALVIFGTVLLSTLRLSTPLLFAAFGGLISERSGVVQIALEGIMLFGALIGAIAAFQTGSSWLGFLAAGLAGTAVCLMMGFFVLVLKIDQIIAGTAVNFLVAGAAPLITKVIYNTTGQTPGLALDARFTIAPLILSGLTLGILIYIYHWTKPGIWLQFAGEEPQALEVAGVSTLKTRWYALAFCGLLAGFGGGSLSLFLSSSYAPNMTAGRGFMALAALIFGRWRPIPTFFACVLFGFVDALQIRLQGFSSIVPVQFVQSLPYLITIVALAGFFGKSQAPKSLGKSLGK